ncbi:DNA translocase FtsK [Desulforhopalus sp. 52FAK]
MGINKQGFDYNYSLDQDILILTTERGQHKFQIDNADVLGNIHDIASLIIKELQCVETKTDVHRDSLNHYDKLLLATLNISEKYTKLEKKYAEVREVLEELQVLKAKLQNGTSTQTTRSSSVHSTSPKREGKSYLKKKVAMPSAVKNALYREPACPQNFSSEIGQERSSFTQPSKESTANQDADHQQTNYLQPSALSQKEMRIEDSSVSDCAGAENPTEISSQAASVELETSISTTSSDTNSVPSDFLRYAEEKENIDIVDTSKVDISGSCVVGGISAENQGQPEKSDVIENRCQQSIIQAKPEGRTQVVEEETWGIDRENNHSEINKIPMGNSSAAFDIPTVSTDSVQDRSLIISVTEDANGQDGGDIQMLGVYSSVDEEITSVSVKTTAEHLLENVEDSQFIAKQELNGNLLDVTAQTAEVVESEGGSVASVIRLGYEHVPQEDQPGERREAISNQSSPSLTTWSSDEESSIEDRKIHREDSLFGTDKETSSLSITSSPLDLAEYNTGDDADNGACLEMQQEKIEQSGEYQLPLLSFLKNTCDDNMVDHERIRNDAELLETKLGFFGIKGEVMGIHPGPVITTYEYKPEPGIKISKIVNLADDLALALSAYSIRIVAPIPGKDVMGIEIPNIKKSLVPFIDIVTSVNFREINSKIPICLGKDIVGSPVVVGLESMPHLLIAGATGTGKSVGLNAMITSILYKASPDEVRFIMIDPKRIELSFYNDIPHLLTPVITDMNKATTALQWLVREMDRRYNLLAEFQVRNIDQFNQKVAASSDDQFAEHGEDLGTLPYIVVIIDELADLMMTASRDIEFALTRLAQMARAAGIHLILATQRPSVDVLTGIIKANFPTRISFQVSSKTDSRTIIDSNGAETLLGNGDMLFVPPGTSRLTRVHGTYLSEDELESITSFIKQQRKPNYMFDVLSEQDCDDVHPNDQQDEYDEKYNEALNFVMNSRQASISGVQRVLRVGYNRAARIIDLMEKNGVVGPPDGAKPRKVLVNDINIM